MVIPSKCVKGCMKCQPELIGIIENSRFGNLGGGMGGEFGGGGLTGGW